MFLRRLPAIYDVVVCQVCLGASGNGPGRGDINARSAPARCLRLRLPIGRTPTRCAISPRQTFRRRCNVRSKASGYSGWDVLRRARSSRAVCDGSASNHVRSSSVTEASGSGRRRPRLCVRATETALVPVSGRDLNSRSVGWGRGKHEHSTVGTLVVDLAPNAIGCESAWGQQYRSAF